MLYSFDIFDTCLIRKCGTPQNLLDILSWQAFKQPVSEMIRKEFVMARRMADVNTYENAFAKLPDIYAAMDYENPLLKSKEELVQIEMDLERKMLVAVPRIKNAIAELHSRGAQVFFISDMYLSADFLKQVLCEQGLMTEGDKVYVSCEVGKRKADGSLFRYIKEEEKLKYQDWHHHGDNESSDYKIPKSLGIKAEQVLWNYTPYQSKWINEEYNPQNRVAETLAGICRTMHHTLGESTHKDFLVDLAAPLFTSFIYRVLKKAKEDGVKRLYFCARDSGTIFHIAEQMGVFFEGIEMHYLYISRDALYHGDAEARMAYFQQCGLASKKDRCAIVDLRTSGKTLCVLNELLQDAGYRPVLGYFFEIFCTGNLDNIPSHYYAELQTPYYVQKPNCADAFLHHYLVEMYISVHLEKRTIDYQIEEGVARPVFAADETEKSEDCATMDNMYDRCQEHCNTLMTFARLFMETHLYRFADEVFSIAMRNWISFCNEPDVYYLKALEDFYSSKPKTNMQLPYVKRMGLVELLRTHGRNTIWKRASVVYSLPRWANNVYSLYSKKKRK